MNSSAQKIKTFASLVTLICLTAYFTPVARATIVITPTESIVYTPTTATVTLTFAGRSDNNTVVPSSTVAGDLIAGYAFTYNLPFTVTEITTSVWTRDFSGNLSDFVSLVAIPPAPIVASAGTIQFTDFTDNFIINTSQRIIGTTPTTIGTVKFTVNRTALDQVFNFTGEASPIPDGGPSGSGFVVYDGGVSPVASNYNPISFTVLALDVTAVPEPGTLLLCGMTTIAVAFRQLRYRGRRRLTTQ